MSAFGSWLAGLIDGEGNFDIHRQRRKHGEYFYCRFELTLRADDGGVLAMLRDRIGGKVYYGGAPRRRWELVARAECVKLMRLLKRHPLQTKKARDFKVWCAALCESLKTPGVNRPEAMLPYWHQLRALRPYGGNVTAPAAFVCVTS